jgi:hypothetical protein
VLFLCAQLPWPAVGRGRRRELELIKRLCGRFDLHLLVVSEAVSEDLANASALRAYCRQIEVFPAAPRRHPHTALEPEESHLLARHRSEEATGRLGEILARDEVDLVHVEGFYLMQHVPDWVHVPVLLVEQNVARPRAPANVDAGRPAQGPRRVRRFRTSTHDRGGVLVASHADRGCDSEGPRHDPGGAAGVRRRADPRRRRPRPASAGARGEPTERAT